MKDLLWFKRVIRELLWLVYFGKRCHWNVRLHVNFCLKNPVEAVKQTVAEIKKNENVDMIACVSHGGNLGGRG